ncbi:hypothetical protein SK128_012049 [Halocaridina rubra]|uniref:CUB domain-containing protein n=1 Tax=Halocaridina rubra TaxID=373956 RepID=A0AAN8WFB7_HALRR
MPIISQGRTVALQFRTMSYFKGSRFRLTYEAVDYSGGPSMTPIGNNANNCSFEINLNSSYRLRNPGFPGYANNLDCTWIIRAQPHERIRVSVYYDLEESYSCQYDRIVLYDDFAVGTRQVKEDSHHQEDFLEIRFISDSITSGRGFTAYLSSECGGYVRGPEGVIASPSYPNDYPGYQECDWIIKVGLGRTITIQFDDFRVTNTTPTCGGDYLLIRNGESLSSPYLGSGRFCGMGIPQVPESSSNILRLQFVSDGTGNDKGFKLRYYENSAACGGLHRLTSDVPKLQLTSPNYPNPPNPHTECIWTIMSPDEKPVSLHFENIDILTYDESCTDAFVEIRDGGTMLSPLLSKVCGRSLPSTQHSTDNAMFIHYYNNVTMPHSGFKAEAAIDTCGGTYNAEDSGIIASPDYPSPYTADVNCTWKIIAPFGHYLRISFLDVDIDNAGDNCSMPDGRVVVREKNSTGEVLGLICSTGDDVMTSVVETGSNVAYITFRGSHNPGRHTGFRFMYNKSIEVCGGDLTGWTGEFTSPGYPHGFSHRRLCTWKITVPEGRRVKLQLLDIDLPHEPFDYRGFVYHQCSGYLMASLQQSFNSSMNIMTVVFISRGHSASRGFRARWSSDDPQECGGTLMDTSGRISSPGGHMGGYNHSLYCIWTVPNPFPSNASFVVHVTDLHIEGHCFDYIMIEGVTANGEVIGIQSVCSDYNMAPIVVPYPTLRISFITDSSVNLTGWNLTYSLSSCGGMVHGPQNTLQSPNYPSNYPDDTHCAWILQYEEGSQIDFSFVDFLLENSLDHDYVLLQNGKSFNSPLIGRYTGTQGANTNIRTMTNALIVQFHTDSSINQRGFRVQASTHSRGCGGIILGMARNISSRGFPDDYDANTECVWEVHVMVGYHIVFTFLERFDIETSTNCNNDYLQFFHSGQAHTDEALAWIPDQKLCGKQMPSPVISRGIKVKLLFHTNEAIQGHGFKVSYVLQCGNNYTSDFGNIASPAYPNSYPHDAVCDYRIIAPSDSYVRILFTSFELEGSSSCHYDWVIVTEEQRRNRWSRPRTWGKYCGRDQPPPLVTARGSVTISFRSDHSITGSGFFANYTVEACGGNLTEPGVIELPTRPYYHNSMYCIWDITAPDNKVPHLKFNMLVLESHTQCRYDSISIYDGLTSDDSKLVSRLCGNHTNDLPIIVGREKQARVIFRTDGSVTRDGFRAVLEFTYACGGNVNISRSGAMETIRSLDINNDGNYEPLLNCHWVIEGLEDQVVTLNFTRLVLEPPTLNDTNPCPYDFVEVRDGPSPDSERIGIYCNATSLPSVSASSNVMFIRFRSDSANQFAGFTATVSNTPHPCGTSSLQATNESQALESPGYPNQYPVSTRCRWIIQSPNENDKIHIEINDMNLEPSPLCGRDQLYISEYVRTEASSSSLPISSGQHRRYPLRIGQHMAYFSYGNQLAHGYCGTSIPHHLTSATNAVELRFISDERTVASGFRLHYSIGNCNRTFNGSSGSIQNSGSRSSCFSTIAAPEGSFINIYFNNFYIRNGDSECGTNAMKIYAGTEATGEPVMIACGWRRPNPVFSTGNALFISYTPRQYGRFSLTYSTSTQAGGCGGSLYVDRRATLTSPGYPGPAATGLDCMFTIAVTPSKHVALRFQDTDFGGPDSCNSTFLEVYDINPSGQSVLFNTICGMENVAPHLAPSYRMALRYVTGGNNQTGQGWSVTIRPAIPHESTVFDQSTTREQEITN